MDDRRWTTDAARGTNSEPPASVQRLSSIVRTHLAVLLAYLAATLILTWPLAVHLGDAVVDGIDPWQSVWNIWAVAGRLATGRSPFHTDLLYYPGGADLYLHTLFPAVSVPLAPLTWLAGPLVAYNVAQLLAFVLTGYTMYLLCRDRGASRLGAFLGGFGLDFSAWHTVRLHGHLNLAAIFWMPIYLLCLGRLGRPARGRMRLGWPLLAGATLALAALSDYQQIVYLGLITLLWLLNRLWARPSAPSDMADSQNPLPQGGEGRVRGASHSTAPSRLGEIPPPPPSLTWGEGAASHTAGLEASAGGGDWDEAGRRNSRPAPAKASTPAVQSPSDSPPRSGEGARERLRRLALLGRVVAAWGVAGVLLSSVLLGVLQEQATGEYARPDLSQVVTYSADLLAYIVPFQYNTFVGPTVTPLVENLWGKLDTERALYLTVTLLLLGAWGLRAAWPRSRVWLNVFAVSILLSLGPALHVDGQASIPLPYLLLYLLPGADSVRVPARFGLVALLALAVLAAWGFTAIQARLSTRRLAVVGGLVVLALLAEDMAIPQTLAAATVPAFYRQIAVAPGTGPALLEVPIRDESIYEYYQTIHGHPLVGGYLSRDRDDPLIEGGPLIRDLKYLDAGDIIRQDAVVAGQVLLARTGVGYILVHKDPPLTTAGYLDWTAAQQTQARALAAAAGRAVYDDAHLTAYAVAPPPADRPPTVALGVGWQPVATDALRGRGRWATAVAELDVDAPNPTTVTLQLTMSGYPARRPVTLLAAGRPLARWDVAAGAPGLFRSPPFLLPVGVTRLTLDSATPPGLLAPASALDRYRAPAILFATELVLR